MKAAVLSTLGAVLKPCVTGLLSPLCTGKGFAGSGAGFLAPGVFGRGELLGESVVRGEALLGVWPVLGGVQPLRGLVVCCGTSLELFDLIFSLHM